MKLKTIFILLGGVIIIFSAGAFVGFNFASSGNSLASLTINELRGGEQDLINPLLECDIGQELISKELKPSKEEVEDYIKEKENQGVVTEVGVYFRDLNNGPTFGINSDMNFIPASLLKLPLMIAYLKKAESEPGLLEQVIEFKEESNDKDYVQSQIPSSERLEVGKSYTIQDLIFRMITNSDNNAKNILWMNIEPSFILDTYRNLGLDVASIDDIDQKISVKQYGAFLRILFNASYLNKASSNMALTFLTQTKFNKGLVKDLPDNIKVAHKFGVPRPEPLKQLHDCGIIYYPSRPYLLCVMTKGKDYVDLENIIGGISRMIYDNIDEQFQNKN